jgi:DNA-directed RNA polymerase specialized sigma24 family protein
VNVLNAALRCLPGLPGRRGTQRVDFAEFYRSFRDDCLRTVLVIVGDRDSAQELVAEAFAWA